MMKEINWFIIFNQNKSFMKTTSKIKVLKDGLMILKEETVLEMFAIKLL